jgi:transaldolase
VSETFEVVATGAAGGAISSHVPGLVKDGFAGKLFAKDPTLWGEDAESESAKRLSWVSLSQTSRPLVAELAGDWKPDLRAWFADDPGRVERLSFTAGDLLVDLSLIRSVASFFVSRVDTEIDKRLEKAGADPSLMGKAGIANAQLAYQAYEEVFSSDRWRALEAKGATVQRPLWASTGVKNPDYPDTLYVSELIAPGVVNTMPEKTMKAYGDHGEAGTPVQKSYEDAAAVLKSVADAGVDLDDVFQVLEDEGVQKFVDAWD